MTRVPPLLTQLLGLSIISSIVILTGKELSENFFKEGVESRISWALVAVLGFMVFVSRLRKIPIAYEGILTFLGGRTKIALKEGNHWLPPFFGLEPVDAKEQTTRNDDGSDPVYIVGELQDAYISDPKKIKRLLDSGREIALMRVPVSVQHKTVDPYRRMDVDESVIKSGLHDAIDNAIRSICTRYSPLAFMGQDGVLNKAIINSVSELAHSWGEEIVRVNVERILFADTDTQKAFERLAIERRNREAEQVELEHVSKQIEKLVNRHKCSFEDGMLLVQSERGKMEPRQDINIRSGKNSIDSLVAAAALHASKNKQSE